ncbi:MAG: hypothetical protein R3D78_10160 [Paracoccaceae bacterium]
MQAAELRAIFETTKVIALVGYSANPARPRIAAQFLKDCGLIG